MVHLHWASLLQSPGKVIKFHKLADSLPHACLPIPRFSIDFQPRVCSQQDRVPDKQPSRLILAPDNKAVNRFEPPFPLHNWLRSSTATATNLHFYSLQWVNRMSSFNIKCLRSLLATCWRASLKKMLPKHTYKTLKSDCRLAGLGVPLTVSEHLHGQEDRVRRWIKEYHSKERNGKVVQLCRAKFTRNSNL